jgi:hypothetical protein
MRGVEPLNEKRQHLANKELTENTPIETVQNPATSCAETPKNDPRLKAICEAWPTLSEQSKIDIMKIVCNMPEGG